MKKTNKILSVILAILMICTSVPFLTFAAEDEALSGICGYYGDNLTWTLDTETGVLEISGTGRMADYSTSSKTRAPWYSQAELITSVVINEGVESIGNYAFRSCANLNSFSFPESLRVVGRTAFTTTAYYKNEENWEDGALYIENVLVAVKDKTTLTSFEIKEGTKIIGGYVFRSSKLLESVVIPEGVVGISYQAFYGCAALTSLELPDSIEVIDTQAFYNCSELVSVKLPANLKTLGWDAFYNCSKIEEVIFPNGIENANYVTLYSFRGTPFANTLENYWEDGALYIGTSLLSVDVNYEGQFVIKEGTTRIAEDAFGDCVKVTSIVIPETVKTIDDGAFAYCGITELELPEGIAVITGSLFEGSEKLEKVVIPESVKAIDEYAFYYCTGLKEVEIPEGVTFIGEEAFTSCLNLTTLYVPETVTKIGDYAIGYRYDETTRKNVVRDDITMICAEGSAAEAYAIANGIAHLTHICEAAECSHYCAVCGEKLSSHNWVKTEEFDATCAHGAYYIHTCSICGDSHESAKGEPLAHTYKYSIVAPTCTETGLFTRTCTQCGYTDDEVLAPLGHKEEIIPEVFATCEEVGYTEGVKCSECGEILVAPEVVPANGHFTMARMGVIENEVPATCTSKGSYDEVFYCACGEEISRVKIVTPKIDHTFEAEVKHATCNEKGFTTYTCEECGYSYTANYVAEKGHTDENGDYVCDDCGASLPMPKVKRCSFCEKYEAKKDTGAGWFYKIIHAIVHAFSAK